MAKRILHRTLVSRTTLVVRRLTTYTRSSTYDARSPKPGERYISNCLFAALRWRLRWGGFLLRRRSRHGWWPHFYWSPDDRTVWYEFNPDFPRRRILPPPLFRGHVTAWSVRPAVRR